MRILMNEVSPLEMIKMAGVHTFGFVYTRDLKEELGSLCSAAESRPVSK